MIKAAIVLNHWSIQG